MTDHTAEPRQRSTAPRVSVLLPVFNAENTIGRAIASIRDQTWTDWVLLVLDDGSTDNTVAVAEEAAQGDRRIRICRLEHAGLIATLNTGLDLATSPYIARMDSDDVSLPDRLMRQVAFLDANPSIVAVGASAEMEGAKSGPPTLLQPPCSPGEIARALEQRSALIHPTVLFRRRAIIEAGGYRSPFLAAEDYDLWLRLVEKHQLANLPDVVLLYSAGITQVSVTRAEQQILSTLGAQVCHRRRVDSNSDPAEGFRGVISREWLIGQGVLEERIDDALISSLAHRSWWLSQLGFFDAAERIARQLLSVDVVPSKKHSRRFLGWWSLAMVARSRHAWGRMATLLLRAAISSPLTLADKVLPVRRFLSRSE